VTRGGGDPPAASRVAQPTLWRSRRLQAGGREQRGPVLLDRQLEREAIDRVLDAARGGFCEAMVLRGGPGTGKTTLLEYALHSAADLRVSTVAGVESEISLEFGGVHQLLVPFLPMLPALPPPQGLALQVAFGLAAGPPPDRFLVGLAVLTVLARAGEEQPLLCLVDDAQWLDAESSQVISFVARRLYADRVGMIATIGEPAPPGLFQEFPALTVDGLPDAEARELLTSIVGDTLHPQVISRILSDTQNNPLALAELGAEFTPEQLSARVARPEPLPLTPPGQLASSPMRPGCSPPTARAPATRSSKRSRQPSGPAPCRRGRSRPPRGRSPTPRDPRLASATCCWTDTVPGSRRATGNPSGRCGPPSPPCEPTTSTPRSVFAGPGSASPPRGACGTTQPSLSCQTAGSAPPAARVPSARCLSRWPSRRLPTGSPAVSTTPART